MSLDVYIQFKKPKQVNYYLEHPYTFTSYMSNKDKEIREEVNWWANITHNLGTMASHVPVGNTTLYMVCWRPEEIGIETVGELLPLLIEGIHYMIDHRKELEQYNAPNGWGTYNGFMRFLLNYKQACEDNDSDCKIYVSR